jgi:hypothetical protein
MYLLRFIINWLMPTFLSALSLAVTGWPLPLRASYTIFTSAPDSVAALKASSTGS